MTPMYLHQAVLLVHPLAYGVSYVHPVLGQDTWWRDRIGEGHRGELAKKEEAEYGR